MQMPELMKVADQIKFETTTLRNLYEHGRIDAVNLRRVVIEYMTGNNHEKLLRGSLEAVEMQRELRNEVKKDDSKPFGRVGFTGRVSADVQNTRETATPLAVKTEIQEQQVLQNQGVVEYFEEDDSLRISAGSAIVLGVLAGIILMVLILFYSGTI